MGIKKRALFITTKNIDYIRNSQEIELLEENDVKIDLLYSDSKLYLWRIMEIYWKLFWASLKKYDFIFVGFAPQLIIPVFGWKFKNKYLCIDFFISVYDTFVFDRKKFKQNSIFAQICKYVDVLTLKKADKVISDTKAHGAYFCHELGLETEKLEVLYLKADKKIYYPKIVGKPDNLADKFIVLYFGSILPLQGVNVIVEAIKKLRDNKAIYFILIGPLKDQKLVEYDNVLCIDWLSQKQLAEYIAMSDLCLGGHFNKENNKAQRTIPGKVYIYEAMGKKMILGDSIANHELYEEDEMHKYVPMSNPDALATLIEQMVREVREN